MTSSQTQMPSIFAAAALAVTSFAFSQAPGRQPGGVTCPVHLETCIEKNASVTVNQGPFATTVTLKVGVEKATKLISSSSSAPITFDIWCAESSEMITVTVAPVGGLTWSRIDMCSELEVSDA